MKRIYLSESYSIIDFDAAYINTVTNIIDSKGFESLLNAFYKSLKKTPIYY